MQRVYLWFMILLLYKLLKDLKTNPVWPFTAVSPNTYQLKTRNIQFYYAFIILLVNTICMLYLLFVSEEKNVIVSSNNVMQYQRQANHEYNACVIWRLAGWTKDNVLSKLEFERIFYSWTCRYGCRIVVSEKKTIFAIGDRWLMKTSLLSHIVQGTKCMCVWITVLPNYGLL